MGSRCMTTEAKWEEELIRASKGGNHQAIETLFRHAALMRRRRAKGVRLTSLDAAPSEDEVPMSESVQGNDPNPEQLFANKELREMIQTNLGQLSSQLFTAFVLCGIEEHSLQEAASRLGITVTAMKARMHRARRKLAESLGPRLERRRTT